MTISLSGQDVEGPTLAAEGAVSFDLNKLGQEFEQGYAPDSLHRSAVPACAEEDFVSSLGVFEAPGALLLLGY